jgi:cadmium resistance protein CadD (predicted permease)
LPGSNFKNVSEVAIITVMNGGDNIGTYVPLFSQAHKVDIAIYVVTYYILLGFRCLAAFLVMRQRHILALAR